MNKTQFLFPAVLSMAILCMMTGCAFQVSVGSTLPSGGFSKTGKAPENLAKGQGWVEITVLDEAVFCPEGNALDCRPPACSLEIRIKKIEYALEHMSAHGDKAPFRVDSGFRFAAPAGMQEVEAIYLCGDDSNPDSPESYKSVVARKTVEVKEGMVTSLSFDGKTLTFLEIREDHASGLDQYQDPSGAAQGQVQQL